MQFHINAFDGTDEAALDRRMSVREDHLAQARHAFENGELLMGGAILNDEGKMIGSTLFVEMESRAALDQWLANDPYTKANAWQTFEIREVKIAKLG